MKQIDFIHSANNRNIILFIHGFMGGQETWNRKNMPSFPQMLRDEKEIAVNFDIAIINYYTKFVSFEKFKNVYNGIKRIFQAPSSVAHKNLGINELSVSLKSIIDQYCSTYENIFIVAHSMGGIIAKAYLLNELASGSERVKIFFSLAVPHNGAELATIGKMLYKRNDQLIGLSNNSTVLTDITRRWIRQYSGIPYTVYFYGGADRVVSPTSAIGMQNGEVVSILCEQDDHYTISKPESKDSIVYTTVKNKLINFIEEDKVALEEAALKRDGNSGFSLESRQSEVSSSENDNTQASRLSPSFSYPMVEGHIPRKVIQFEKYNTNSLLINNEDFKDLLDVVKENKHVVLLGGAGTGKSVEMRHIAAICSQESSLFIPILIKLNKYVPRSLNEVISEFWAEWNLVSDNRLLIILDGLDEVESHYKKDAIKYIELFSEQHPEAQIIVSCRQNFYQAENEHFSGTLQGFDTFLLYNLNQQNVDSYIDSFLGRTKAQKFNMLIGNTNMKSLISIPFYLVRILDRYFKSGILPKNKAGLYQDLIKESLYNDIEHFKNAIDLSKEEQRLMVSLETVALSMEDLGRNYLTDQEFTLVIDEKTKELLTHCTLWKKSEENGEIRWQFEHNNFQEFLAARILSRQEFETIKDFLSFSPEHRKVIPSWVNTLSFLVSIMDCKDKRFIELLEWLSENDPEMVIQFELDKIDESLRNQIFQHIFNYYEKKEIWINRGKFDLKGLSNFGNTLPNVEFLMDKILKGHYTSRINALRLLEFMKIPISKKSILSIRLTDIVVNHKEHRAVRSTALRVLTKYKWGSSEQVEKIVSKIRESSDDMLRTYLYRYLAEHNHIEENIDVFLEGIKYVKFNFSRSESRLIDEKVELEKGLKTVKSPSSMIKILQFFNENTEKIQDLSGDIFEIIGINSSIAYKNDIEIFDLAFSLFKTLHKKYWTKEAKEFSVFFDESQTRHKAIELLFEQRVDQDSLRTLGFLIDTHSIDFVSQKYLEHELSDKDIWTIQQGIYTEYLYKTFNKCMNEISGNKFILPPTRDYEQERRESLKHDIALLFNKETFLKEVQVIYENEGKESFTQDELVDIRLGGRKRNNYSTIVIDQIYHIAESEPALYEKVIEIIENFDWNTFTIIKIYEIMSSSSEVKLTDDQVQWVSDWCIKNVDSVDFNTACRQAENGGITTSVEAIIFWYFLRKYNLTYPKKIMFDMISFDWIEDSQLLGIKYLEQYLDIEEMSEKVWVNLQNGIELDDILNNHLDFCKRHSIYDVIPYALEAISDSTRSFTTRTTALETYLELSQDREVLISKLTNINDDFKWEVIKKIFDNDIGVKCETYLLSVMRESDLEEEQLKSISFLIKLQNIEALKFYVGWIERQVERRNLIKDPVSLANVQVIEALPYLMDLLTLSYTEGFEQDEFNPLDVQIKNALTNIALKSKQYFNEVQTVLEVFIRDNKHLKFINFLHLFVEDLESKYYIMLQSSKDISEVIQRLPSNE
ncbi:hypothetical protein [Priestia sp. P5]|uniref:PGAP1-like alpha/beta domain-containing protein n=1 Tax=Priestia sp. P5 TaxID=2917806 RepID=UPI002404BB9A|nr:hypothetical protein [Priestia sp. P5]MDG0059151.1 hypothetical protein [Priestia sp. P5]